MKLDSGAGAGFVSSEFLASYFAVALVVDALRETSLGHCFRPILLDHEGKVADASLKIDATDDLTERLNELLRAAGYDQELPQTERKIAV